VSGSLPFLQAWQRDTPEQNSGTKKQNLISERLEFVP
jgi:hypothetical protein